jgi:DNA (cytosine-5)-methyltransferase 1
LAAKKLGWKTAFFSEIEAFPRAVLAHHYPHVPLHGDFTTINGDTYGTVDLLVGGTPCQSFSVAGKRLGLDDPRGNLALEYVRLAERVDAKWLVFENVPGLLSSAAGDDFAAFISAVTGHEYRSPATGWANAGIAEGRAGRWGLAWRILDAQYFGVAQRRRRVFVVGYRGDWRPAAAVLLEPESLRGNPPPSRKAQSPVAALTANSVGTCGADDNQAQAGHLIAPTIKRDYGKGYGDGEIGGGLIATGFGGGNCSGPIEVAACLTAKGVRQDFEVETFIAHTFRGEGFDASEDGTGRGTPLVPTVYPILEPGSRTGVSTTDPRAGIGIGEPSDPMFTLQAGKQHAIAVSIRGRDGGATAEVSRHIMPALRASQGGGDKPHVLLPSAVRRLTPTECERLQGMPDNFSLIPWRGKSAEQCPDGPRYKAIGNSMAVPVMSWIFDRIQTLHDPPN